MRRTLLYRRQVPYRTAPRPSPVLVLPRAGGGWGLLAVAAVVSVGLHGIVAAAMGRGPAHRNAPKRILVPVVSEPASKKAETTEARPRPAPPRPRPVEPARPRPLARPRPVVHTHRRVHAPARHDAPPPRRVFGIDHNSLAQGHGSTVAVRVGNDLMKEQEKEYTPPKKVQPLPEEPPAQVAPPPPPPPPRPRPRPRPRTYDLRAVTVKPHFLERVAPRYTDAAQDEEIEGVVKVEVVLDEKGRPMRVRIVKSLGHGLDQSVIRAVKASRFSPAKMAGRPVRCRLIIPYRFRLAD